jgi:hypothetical protein
MDLVKKVDECEIIYIYIYCRTVERGYVEKRPRWLKKGGGRC